MVLSAAYPPGPCIPARTGPGVRARDPTPLPPWCLVLPALCTVDGPHASLGRPLPLHQLNPLGPLLFSGCMLSLPWSYPHQAGSAGLQNSPFSLPTPCCRKLHVNTRPLASSPSLWPCAALSPPSSPFLPLLHFRASFTIPSWPQFHWASIQPLSPPLLACRSRTGAMLLRVTRTPA